MNENEEFGTSPKDAALDKHLLTLQRFAPSPGFADRVLARVVVRAPALVRVRRRAASVVTGRRLWWASGLAAASSTAWIVGLANWLTGVNLEAASLWLSTEVGLPLWNGAVQGAAIASRGAIGSVMMAYGALGNALFPVTALAMITPVLSGWGLYLTIKQTSTTKRIPAYAAR